MNETNEGESSWWDWDWNAIGHTALDIVGFVPAVGEVADVANAAWYAAEERYLDAGLSLISVIPVVGDVIGKGGKLLSKVGGETVYKLLKEIDIRKALEQFRDHPKLGKYIDKIIEALEEWMDDLARRFDDTPAGNCKTNCDIGKGAKRGDWVDHKWGDPNNPPCFPVGTVVKTPQGDIPIEQLSVGDTVYSFNLDTFSTIKSRIVNVIRNWAQELTEISFHKENLLATHGHPFFDPDDASWTFAADLSPFSKILTIQGEVIEVSKTTRRFRLVETFNLEIDAVHNYFVGQRGILVHNASSFESVIKTNVEIYQVVDNNGKVVYVGQTSRGIDTRFSEHLDNPNRATWRDNNYRVERVDGGSWTKYEAAVWEQHYIDANGGKANLENSIDAITQDKYEQYKGLHNPCS